MSITLNTIPAISPMPLGQVQETLVMASLRANPLDARTRTSIDLVAVVDRSGSMEGKKMNTVKNTLGFIVTQLTENDSFGIVTFESGVVVDLPLTKMTPEQKLRATHIISNIRTSSSTNLHDGLMTGLKELIRGTASVASCLILTDGQPNASVVDPRQVAEISSRFIQSNKSCITCQCFGYGRDHNPEFMRQIATANHGMFYFVENSTHVSDAFGSCLGGLLSIAAQDIHLRIQPCEGTEILRVMTNFTVTRDGDTHIVNIPDMFEDENRDILISIRIPSNPVVSDSESVLHVSADYLVPENTERVRSPNFDTKIKRLPADEFIALLNPPVMNAYVDMQHNRIICAETLMTVSDRSPTHLANARTIVQNAIDKINASMTASDPYVVSLIRDLTQTLNSLQDHPRWGPPSVMLPTAQSAGMSHFSQRSTTTTGDAYTTRCQHLTSSKSTAYHSDVHSSPAQPQHILTPIPSAYQTQSTIIHDAIAVQPLMSSVSTIVHDASNGTN